MSNPRKRSRALTTLAALVLGGCANFSDRAYAPKGPESPALQIAKAAALAGLRDVDIGQTAASPGGWSVVQPVAGGIGGALSPAPGLSGLSGGVFGALASFGERGPEWDSSYNHVLAWVPLSEASTAEAARDLVDRLVVAAFRDALAETLGAGYKIEAEPMTVAQFRARHRSLPVDRESEYGFTLFSISGEQCSGTKVCAYSAHIRALPRKGFAPALIGGGPAWSFTRYSGLPTLATSCWDVGQSRVKLAYCLPDRDMYLAVSRRLPAWVFIYLAPGTTGIQAPATLTYGPMESPVVVSEGKGLRFFSNDDWKTSSEVVGVPYPVESP